MKQLDLICKIFDRLRDLFIYYFKWKLILKKIGRKSYIKRGVLVSGNPKRIIIGDNFKIWERCILGVGKGEILIGNNGLLGVNSIINASEGTVKIGDNVAIAPFCQIYSYSHSHDSNKLVTESYKIGNVTIENNVFIGSNVVILPGVTICEGAVIAAGSVVTKNVPKNCIYGGTPAKEISKKRI